MKITAIKTKVITTKYTIEGMLDEYIHIVPENSVIVVTSKILSIMQGDVVSLDTNKAQLIQDECEQYIAPDDNPFHSTITITGHKLSAAAGIDESNADNVFVLLPSEVQHAANVLRAYIRNTYKINNVGVIITDSRSSPLHLGTHGVALAYSGLLPLRDYIGTNDLFGRKIIISRLNIINGISAAAVVMMGEGLESTPLAIVSELQGDIFCDNDPSKKEINEQFYEITNDLYVELLQSDKWQKGGGGYLARQ